MIKFTVGLNNGGTLYGFGLSEANLNRMEFNEEHIFFDFGYAGQPELFGLIPYVPIATPEELVIHMQILQPICLAVLDESKGVTTETLRVFPIAKSIMQKFRATPYWGFETYISITHANDMQLFFAGPDERSIERYFVQQGLINKKTRRTTKGFG